MCRTIVNFILIFSVMSSELWAEEITFTYYSFTGGEVNITVNDSEAEEGSYMEWSIAELSRLSVCEKESKMNCLFGSMIKVAIPKDLFLGINSSNICSSPEWSYKDYKFKVVPFEGHEINKCGKVIVPMEHQVLGRSFKAIKVEVEKSGQFHSYFLWSETIGLVAFSDVAGSEFWINNNCGFGSKPRCNRGSN